MQHIPTRAFGANLSIDCNDLFIDELDEHGNVIVADIFHDLLFLLLGDVLWLRHVLEGEVELAGQLVQVV